MVAGSPTAIANLWDVTDRDIDRFSKCLLERWLQLSNARDSRDLQHDDLQQEKSIGWSVDASRQACRLPHLIGAAPVCFGIPSSVQ